jgi:hypothetical protein
MIVLNLLAPVVSVLAIAMVWSGGRDETNFFLGAFITFIILALCVAILGAPFISM